GMWMGYSFPGNVRELRNIVIRLITKYAGKAINNTQLEAELDMESVDGFPVPMEHDAKSQIESAKKHLQSTRNFSLDEVLGGWEKSYVEAALALTHGNLSQAAKMLGVNRTTLYSRMQTYAAQSES
ncbi:MAG: helix-turn-helix domain-containing protein, partial [Burkholderiales bacterium]